VFLFCCLTNKENEAMAKGFYQSICCCVVLLAVFSESARTQSQLPPNDPMKLDVDLVNLEAQVLNKKSGQAVGGLKQMDFLLYEDKVKQTITHFTVEQRPLSVVILEDVSRSTLGSGEAIQKGAVQALSLLKAEDEVALINFADNAALIQSFTKDKKQVTDKVMKGDVEFTELSPPTTWGGSHIGDAIYEAAKYLKTASNPEGRRIIIAITDNVPAEASIRHSRSEVRQELYETGSSVYGLIVQGHNPISARILPGLLKIFHGGGGNVNTYAEATGGVVLRVGNASVGGRFAELIGLLRSRYSFGYVSTNSKRDGKFRQIKVQVTKAIEQKSGEIIVITRKGYYAPKPAATRQ
jgi:Ca-activated chloride channel homolog